MIKKYLPAVIMAALILPLCSLVQGKEEAADSKKVTVWQEIMLEDFETSQYTDRNITFNRTNDQEAKLSIRDQFPAVGTSKKYLGIKVKSRGGDMFIIKPAKDIIIDKYCKSISFWVFGKRTLGELSIMLQDTKQENHRIVMVPTIDFRGWKKVTYVLTSKIIQGEDFLNQKKTMKLLNIQYRLPKSSGKPSEWSYLYLDDIDRKSVV